MRRTERLAVNENRPKCELSEQLLLVLRAENFNSEKRFYCNKFELLLKIVRIFENWKEGRIVRVCSGEYSLKGYEGLSFDHRMHRAAQNESRAFYDLLKSNRFG